MATSKKRSKKSTAKKAAAYDVSKIGGYARKLIADGKYDTVQIVTRVTKKFPNSAFKPNHVSWYRGHM